MAMKKSDVKLVVSTLADFLDAGLSLSESVGRLSTVSPKNRSVWESAKHQIEKGYPFSESLVGLWDDSLVSVVRAGEGSGNVAGMFRDIESALDIELEVAAQLKRLLYPLAMLVGGLSVGVFFMLTVIPGIAGSLSKTDSAILLASIQASEFVDIHFPFVIMGLFASIGLIVLAVRSKPAKSGFLALVLNIPLLRETITYLKFGVWSRYLSLTLSANLGTMDSLRMTENILDGKLRDAVANLRRDLANNVRLDDAVDIDKFKPGDPRIHYFPFFIANAFATGAQTGKISEALAKASPTLINQGKKKIESIVGVFRAVAIGIAAVSILAPLAIVYLEMFSSMDGL